MKKIIYKIAAASPVLILLYLIYLIAFNVPIIYAIDIGSKGDTDPGKDDYLCDMTKQVKLSESMSDDNDTFRNMTGSPVHFYITPKS